MGSESGLNYTNVSEDLCLCNEPALLWGVVGLGRDDGWEFKVYDGRDATSGRLVVWVRGSMDVSNPIMFPKPVLLAMGLFVDLLEDVEDVLVIWERAPMSTRFERGVRE